MRIIGLTGGIACGKSTIAAMFRDLGLPVVDADAVSRGLTAPGGPALPAIREAFGNDVFAPDGTLDRAALSAVVFGDEEALAKLNAITHPMIESHMLEQTRFCRKQGAKIVLWDVPLLFEAGLDHWCDLILCAVADESTQITRLASRDQLSPQQALARIHSQMPVSQKAARSDVVLNTQQPLSHLQKEVQTLYHSWLNA